MLVEHSEVVRDEERILYNDSLLTRQKKALICMMIATLALLLVRRVLAMANGIAFRLAGGYFEICETAMSISRVLHVRV